ncbi:MAG: polyprenyl synthetase family protein [Promethearchaeota archaeon]
MDFKRIISDRKVKVDDELRAIFAEKVETSNRPILKDYYRQLGEYIAPPGGVAKRVRPILVEVAAGAWNGMSGGEALALDLGVLRRAACSVELLHNASLIHDDIIDNDEFRRGEPSFHVRYGNLYGQWAREGRVREDDGRQADFARNMGILGGDHVYFLGLEILWKLPVPAGTRVELVRTYQQAFNGIVEGVIVEEHLENAASTTLEEYLYMVKMKTAHLLAKSTEMGLVLGGAPAGLRRDAEGFMMLVGQAFQVRDDILGTFGDSSHKPTDSDILEGKKTALSTLALELADAGQRETLERVLGNHAATPGEVEEVRNVFEECGALAKTEEMLEHLTSEARDLLSGMRPQLTGFAAEFLGAFAEYVVKRAF